MRFGLCLLLLLPACQLRTPIAGESASGSGSDESGTAETRGDPSTTTSDSGDTGDPGTILEGEFLLAVATTLDPSRPFQYIAVAAAKPETLQLVMIPLSLEVGSTTEPRLPLDPPILLEDVPLDSDGGFVVDFGLVEISGQANPLTGSDITVELVFDGRIQNDDLLCGDVRGRVITPIDFDLVGSTFAASRIATDEPLPVVFPTSCG